MNEQRRRLNQAVLFWHMQRRNQDEWQRNFDRLRLMQMVNPGRFALLQQRQRRPVRKTKRS